MRLEYEAPDIYPAGVKMERVLTLPGDQNVVIEDTTVTPKGVAPGQAYVLENSMSFQQADQPHYRRWFMPGKAPAEFSPEKELAFGEDPRIFRNAGSTQWRNICDHASHSPAENSAQDAASLCIFSNHVS